MYGFRPSVVSATTNFNIEYVALILCIVFGFGPHTVQGEHMDICQTRRRPPELADLRPRFSGQEAERLVCRGPRKAGRSLLVVGHNFRCQRTGDERSGTITREVAMSFLLHLSERGEGLMCGKVTAGV